MSFRQTIRRRAISVIELVIAVVILGILAALAIPKFGKASSPTVEDELRVQLRVLRTAIELYHRDHQAYPAASSDLADAEAGGALFEQQLAAGTNAYLRNGLPRSPLIPGEHAVRVRVLDQAERPTFDPDDPDADWLYNPNTGEIVANSGAHDPNGKRYDEY
ncbi:MAG: type II secretion system protein [Planctomycetes bacterium]|nr:type II secretion system protein [Planctomycetota bacterium]